MIAIIVIFINWNISISILFDICSCLFFFSFLFLSLFINASMVIIFFVLISWRPSCDTLGMIFSSNSIHVICIYSAIYKEFKIQEDHIPTKLFRHDDVVHQIEANTLIGQYRQAMLSHVKMIEYWPMRVLFSIWCNTSS